ncbi:MAG: hypothetical protein D6729_16625 [Deltaproteobacteria bacterium]|nr:MAG: hypothetical protein D6729_16625 [Deltaproteobacteria bacterium]
MGLDDVVDVDALLYDDGSSAGAAMVGDPATFLLSAQQQVSDTNSHIRSALGLLKAIVESREPDLAGRNRQGQAYAIWDGQSDGKDVRLLVLRVNKRRVRYLLAAREGAGAPWKGLMTGIFIKFAPRVGGGRLHISLSNISDLFDSTNSDGSIHVVFAIHRADARGRRILYLNVKDRGDPEATPLTYGSDIIHFPGQGGRMRAVFYGDLLPGDVPPVAGTELFAMRVLWRTGQGGRADALIAHALPPPAQVLGTAHECWDADGRRTAYLDTFGDNDAEDPNEGDVTDAASCGGFGEDQVPEEVVDSAHDADPQLDALLAEAEADTIDADEVDAPDIDPEMR